MTTDDITGDALRTRPATDAYRDGYDAIEDLQKAKWYIERELKRRDSTR